MVSNATSCDWIPFNLVKGRAFGQDCPDGARHFVGHRRHHDIEMASLQQSLYPVAVSAATHYGASPGNQQGPPVRFV
jgi:hypothetical protein